MVGSSSAEVGRSRRPAGALALVAATLLVAWGAVVLVDVLDVAGSRQRLFVDRQADFPHLYYHLADNTHPLEWVQWALLVAGCVAAAFSAGRSQLEDRDLAVRIASFAGFLGLLAVKDAGSPRAVVIGYVQEWIGDTAGVLVQLLIFGLLGVVGLVVLVRLWPVVAGDRVARSLVLGGYGVYALAAVMSASSRYWYDRGGNFALDTVFAGRVVDAPVVWEGQTQGFMFMDTLVEESVELVAVGLLAAAAARLLDLTVPAVPVPETSGHPEPS